ncbi:MAG: FtsB family cell division protein [Xanthobacteraceae bacterium]
MVSRKRLRSILNTLALYLLSALLIGYFGVNAYHGAHGLIAKKDIDRQTAALSVEFAKLKSAQKEWQRRVSLLQADHIDADMLDERARALLDYVDPNDLVMMIKPDKPADDPTGP